MSPELTDVKSAGLRPRPGNRPSPGAERGQLLADVAEMYFLEGRTQADIARRGDDSDKALAELQSLIEANFGEA